MFDFGKSLKDTREAKGLTVPQIAERTHLLPRIIEDLEFENFSRFPAQIYGKGYIKIYCAALGLDPAPYLEEFTAVINGDRTTPIVRKKPSPPAPATMPEPEPAPEQTSEPMHADEPAFAPKPATEPEPAPKPETEPEPVPEPTTSAAEEPFKLEAERTTFSRYASPLYDDANQSAPPRHQASRPWDNLKRHSPQIFRLLIIGVAAVLLLFGFIAAIRGLYRMTTAPAPEASEPVATNSATKTISNGNTTGKTTALPRKHIVVSPLYGD